MNLTNLHYDYLTLGLVYAGCIAAIVTGAALVIVMAIEAVDEYRADHKQ